MNTSQSSAVIGMLKNIFFFRNYSDVKLFPWLNSRSFSEKNWIGQNCSLFLSLQLFFFLSLLLKEIKHNSNNNANSVCNNASGWKKKKYNNNSIIAAIHNAMSLLLSSICHIATLPRLNWMLLLMLFSDECIIHLPFFPVRILGICTAYCKQHKNAFVLFTYSVMMSNVENSIKDYIFLRDSLRIVLYIRDL